MKNRHSYLIVIFFLLVIAGGFRGGANGRAAAPFHIFLPLISRPLPAGTHYINTRTIAGQGQLYDRRTGARFTPRGSNYLQLQPEETYRADMLFVPGHYNAARVESDLAQMESLGFNVVRVFTDNCRLDCIGDPAGGLRAAYLANMADFLQRAKAHNIFVLLTGNDLPLNGGYADSLPCCAAFDGYRNAYFLSAAGLTAWQNFWQDLILGLQAQDTPLEIILAYQIVNEQFTLRDQPPLSLTSGMVTTANGRTYNMSDPAAKRQMAEDSVIYFADSVRDTILTLDPTALVTMGFFPPDEPYPARPGDNRLVLTSRLLVESSLDLFDLHAYPWGDLTLVQQVENFGAANFAGKPILMGEFGAFKYNTASPAAAASALVQWQVESCYYNFDGWLYWLWAAADEEVWGGLEGGGAINQALAPVTRPDACQTGDFPGLNLALGGTAAASNALPDQPPAYAIDGRAGTNWGAGAGPPQWIEIDLGAEYNVAAIRLLADQWPAGATRHRIWGRSAAGSLTLLTEFNGSTTGGDTLTYAPPAPWTSIRIIRVETVGSPSWVSWFEIEIISAGPAP